ncbi:MAG: hypothetical protein ACHQQS_09290 [Thermoanaerobaculales bacterium]
MLRLVNETRFGEGSQAEVLQRFALRLVYLLDSPGDAYAILLRRLIGHNVLSESRVLADSDQRDHLLHVTQVYLLGWVVLHRCSVFYEAPSDWAPYGWRDGAVFPRLNEAWLIAALLHDCGYSVEYAGSGISHEARVVSTFAGAYHAGIPGEADPAALGKFARQILEARCAETARDFREMELHEIATILKEQASRPDHGLASAFAVLREGDRWCGTNAVVAVAARAIACHNYQYYVNGKLDHGHPINRFFSLSFRTEPIAALLHLCDELQEWSREREDERSALSLGARGRGFLATYLTELRIPDSSQLAIEVGRRRELHSEDRSKTRERRIRLEQERKLSDATRRFSRLFPPTEDPRFRLRLRVQESVGGGQCRAEFRINSPLHGSAVADLDDQWRRSGLEALRTFEPVSVRGERGLQLEVTASTARLEGGGGPLRYAMVLPGGRGKSTLLKQVALIGLSGFHVYYVEQLPEGLFDLRGDLERLCSLSAARPFVFFDHLDRLVNSDSLAFWQDQLSSLSAIAAGVILACRTEEYDRYYRAPLGSDYRILGTGDWYSNSHGITQRLTDGLYPAADDLEHALNGAGLRGVQSAISSFALAVGTHRRWPAEVDTRWLSEDIVGIGRRPVLVQSSAGTVSFIHDCVQDLFAAGKLLKYLRDGKAGVSVSLVGQPHDLFRLLVELLVRERDGLFGSVEDARVARFQLARSLSFEPTVQQWLYDTGRLQMATWALSRWASFNDDQPWSRSIARKLAGHAAYGRASLHRLRQGRTREEDLFRFRAAVRLWVGSAGDAEEALLSGEIDAKQFAWHAAFLADHLLLALTRIASVPDLFSGACEAALEGSRRLSPRAAEPVGPGWIRELLLQFAAAHRDRDVDYVFESVFEALAARRGLVQADSLDALDVRRAHITSHLGLLYIDHAFAPVNRIALPETELERLRRAELWYERSISYRESVLLAMEAAEHSGVALEGERFATLAAGASDAAHQYRGVFEALLLSSRSPEWNFAKLLELADAYARMKNAWGRAENCLGPTERLGNMYTESVLHLAIGEEVEWLAGRPSIASRANLVDEIRTGILQALARLSQRRPQIAESSSRYEASEMTPERILSRFSAVPDLPRRLAAVLHRH